MPVIVPVFMAVVVIMMGVVIMIMIMIMPVMTLFFSAQQRRYLHILLPFRCVFARHFRLAAQL